MNPTTDFLYARPSFWGGTALLLDFGDTLTEYNRAASGNQADDWALAADWVVIGGDFHDAVDAIIDEKPVPTVSHI